MTVVRISRSEMIYLTGDIHGSHSIQKLSSKNWPEGKSLTRDDYLIILGDFGLVWSGSKEERYWLGWLESKPWTTLFIDGNHENHRMLSSYPQKEWMGGMVHEIRPHVLHLMRGYVFDIDGNSVLAMGGAHSYDRQYRTEGISWWPEEVPNHEERGRCESNLEARDWHVDYVLTHDAPATVCVSLANTLGLVSRLDEYEEWLDTLAGKLDYKQWYCGHWHTEALHERLSVMTLYDYIVELGE